MITEEARIKTLIRAAFKAPPQPGLVAFVGRSRGYFIDNVKYAFLRCVEAAGNITPFFITTIPEERDKLAAHDLPVYLFPEEEAVMALARASTLVADDFYYKFNLIGPVASRARTVQLWHGVPLKKIGFPELERLTPGTLRYELVVQGYAGYDVMVSTSEYFNEHCFTKAFQAESFPTFGLPRNDVLLREPGPADLINTSEDYLRLARERREGAKVVLYLPTFRDSGSDPITDKALDLEALQRFGEAKNVIFALKFHPYLQMSIKSELSHIRLIESSEDVYPYLRLCDLLITDYSSIYFDYLLLDRPVCFYPYDLDKYQMDRGLFFPYNDFTPGPKCSDFQQLFTQIRATLLRGEDHFSTQRKEIRDLAFDHQDGDSAERVRQFLETFSFEVRA